METGLILFGAEISTNSDLKVVKVIEPVYQVMYEVAYHPISLAAKQDKIYKYLIDYIDEHYPGWGIQNFVDLSNDEARDVNVKLIAEQSPHKLVSWGMYVLIQRDTPHIRKQTEVKQIEDNIQSKAHISKSTQNG